MCRFVDVPKIPSTQYSYQLNILTNSAFDVGGFLIVSSWMFAAHVSSQGLGTGWQRLFVSLPERAGGARRQRNSPLDLGLCLGFNGIPSGYLT